MLVAHICDTLAPMAEDTGLSLDIDLAPNVITPGDRDELARVLENLIENAIKYGRPDGDAAGKNPRHARRDRPRGDLLPCRTTAPASRPSTSRA